jgi:hypothetical protein
VKAQKYNPGNIFTYFLLSILFVCFGKGRLSYVEAMVYGEMRGELTHHKTSHIKLEGN